MLRPLSGLLVLEFGAVLAGPYATQILAEMGAEVVKIEPFGGQRSRKSGLNWLVNRSKESFAVDLATEAGRVLVRDLAARADVVIENYKRGAMQRLGLAYEELHRLNPRLVYCSLSGYGERGPIRDRPGQDLLAQAFSGLMSITGFEDRLPVPAGTFVGDVTSGFLSALGIVLALYERERSGEGQHVGTSLLMTLLALQGWEMTEFLTVGSSPRRVGSGHYIVSPVYGAYRCLDGAEVVLVGEIEPIAGALGALDRLRALDLPGWDVASLKTVRNELKTFLQSEIGNWRRDELVEHMATAGLWCQPVLTYPEVSTHPQVWENEMLSSYEDPELGHVTTPSPPIALSRTPAVITGPPPAIGQNTDDVLTRHLGMAPDDIAALRRARVVK
jgi:crotonobetainyl-CoA:carnitine CoA-transferase CaiB-like acyl-CoA transferase